jgi:hypothetical protein
MHPSGLLLYRIFSQIEIERQSQRYSDGERANHRKPKHRDPSPTTLGKDENKQNERRDDYIQPSESSNSRFGNLPKEQGNVEAMIRNPGNELRIGENYIRAE